MIFHPLDPLEINAQKCSWLKDSDMASFDKKLVVVRNGFVVQGQVDLVNNLVRKARQIKNGFEGLLAQSETNPCYISPDSYQYRCENRNDTDNSIGNSSCHKLATFDLVSKAWTDSIAVRTER